MTSQHDLQMFKTATFKYILNQSVKKTPIKSADIVKHCLRGETKLFERVFPTVCEKLTDIFRLKITEIKDAKLGRFYLITSSLKAACEFDYTEPQKTELRLLMIILPYIYMKDGAVLEGTIYAFLKKLGIESDDDENFGNFKKTISETFVKQMYLKREKSDMGSNNNDDKFQYSWGYRAPLEFSKKDILEMVAKLFGKPSMTFTKQYAEVYGQAVADDNETDDNVSQSEAMSIL